ncbi:MAG TPA: pyrroloquinoline quinone-dependent dehydrogenase [Puia sp.]|jgi:quinoprotein glucose dehydrogenase|nr:pyrroloquinoline quinone-dependent dehydrogenase [Puia sp.]
MIQLKHVHLLLLSIVLCSAFFNSTSCRFSGAEIKKVTGHQTDWPLYGGNKAGNRYSHLTQININNVNKLQVAWIYNSDTSIGLRARMKSSELECQPVEIDNILYAVSPTLKLFALHAESGKKIWEFDPFKNTVPRLTSCRGVVYWKNGEDKRILYSAGSSLYAINALTGVPVESFGISGKIDLHTGLDNHHDVSSLYVAATTPGIVYKNTLIIGSAVSEGGDAAPGYIRGFDVISGKLKWIFHTVPEPGEAGYETWPKDAYKKVGAANNWSGLTVDEKRGVVYLGTGSPAADFYGGERAGINLFSDCILALDAESGKLKWYYQIIHHDLWDRDIPCPPNLTTIVHEGKRTDVVVQATKDGLIYVLDRDSGKSIFPVVEKKVPTKGLPGEHPWPLQKFPVRPLPFSMQVFNEEDITNISAESHDYIKKIFDSTEHANKFTPPNEKGTLLFGYSGGAEWGGNAIDSEGILFQNTNNGLWKLEMESLSKHKKRKSLPEGQNLYVTYCSSCHGKDKKGNGAEIPGLLLTGKHLKENEIDQIIREGRRRMPSFTQFTQGERNAIVQFLLNDQKTKSNKSLIVIKEMNDNDNKKTDFPFLPPWHAKVWAKVFDQQGYPGIKPPWGTLNAIDLNTGEYKWRIPLGEFPELTKKGIPVTGTENYGGPIVTDGGLVFIAATRDEKIRAFNKQTGEVVWEFPLPAAGFATPITYEINGKQYLVIAAGGGRGLKSSGVYIAFALP